MRPPLCAITNPSTNSYRDWSPALKRPSPSGTPWPIAVLSFGSRLRQSPQKQAVRARNPDATCNPYYAFAAILMAGLDGIQNRIDPHERGWGPYDFNLYTLSDREKAQIDSLPKSRGEALDTGGRSRLPTQGGVFPPRLLEIWIEKKRAELEEIDRQPTPQGSSPCIMTCNCLLSHRKPVCQKGTPVSKSETGAFFLSSFHSCVLFKGLKRYR